MVGQVARRYTYDAQNRLTAKATPEGTLSYTYDLAGNVASVTSSNANGVWLSYTYDNVGRLSTVVDNRLSGNTTTTYTYDPASNLATATYPNGLQSTFTYDQLDRLTKLSTPVSSYTYQLGPVGNHLSATEGTGRTLNWTYDGVYRLTNETISADPARANGTVAYGLDPVGNRKSETSTIGGLEPGSFSYNLDDEASTDSYDLNGNTISTGGKAFAYDSENHLMTMATAGTTASMIYDGDGNRVAKMVNGVTTYYLVDDLNPTGYPQVVEELTANGAVERQYTYGLQLISQNQMVSNAWTPSFFETDGAGSVRQLSSAAGVPTDAYEFDAFGNETNSAGSTPNNYLYRGEQWDPDLGLYYLRARYYNPLTGRFVSVDSEAGEGQRRYQYAASDPVNGMDPSGNEAIIEFSLLQFYPGRLGFIHVTFPTWCGLAGGFSLAGCDGGDGPGTGGPQPPPHKIVKVCWRSLLKGEWPKTTTHHIYPLFLYHHTYIEIDETDGTHHTWGVLGGPDNSPPIVRKDQEVRRDDDRNSPAGWSGQKIVPATDSEADILENTLRSSEFANGSICPSCGKSYRNWWWRVPPDGFNSNTYTFNLIKNWGKAPPEGPALGLFSPGYHDSPAYTNFYRY
jgi:RHS repeat-associated protein